MPSMKNKPEGLLRISMLGQKHSFSREGGIEVAVGELAGRMAELGHFVTLFDRSPHPDSIQRPETERLKIRYLPTVNHFGLAALTSSFFGAIRAAFGRYDVVHFHAEGPSAACLIPRLFGKRVVCTVHGLDWQREKWGRIASAYIHFGEKMAARHANEIIVLNHSTQDYFLRTYGRATHIIPNGADPQKKVPPRLICQKWDLEEGSYVLFVGRLVPEKGLRLLLNAWNGLNTDKKLVIAGSGDSDAFVRELKQMAGKNVLFTGFADAQLLGELYSNAYLFVLPSDLEGMPLALLEAMSYGCCCLTSDIPACRETAGDSAAYFARGSQDALTGALTQLLDKPDIVERYKETSAEYVRSRYVWDDITLQTIAVYLGKGPGAMHS